MSSFSELTERFQKTPTQNKVLALLVISGLFGAIFYFMFYSDMMEQATRLVRKQRELEQKKASYEEKKQKYMAFRDEVKKLLQEKKELIKVLPTEAEIPSFLQSLHAQAELSGLNILTFDKRPEVRRDFYAEIPVRMIISGTYHQIMKFYYSVGNLKRIVNIQNVMLSGGKPTDTGVVLKAMFVASTFRFIEPQAPPRRG